MSYNPPEGSGARADAMRHAYSIGYGGNPQTKPIIDDPGLSAEYQRGMKDGATDTGSRAPDDPR